MNCGRVSLYVILILGGFGFWTLLSLYPSLNEGVFAKETFKNEWSLVKDRVALKLNPR
jgi:hypothetical protein